MSSSNKHTSTGVVAAGGISCEIIEPQQTPSKSGHQSTSHAHLEDCAICMESMNKNNNFAKTSCGHSFCLSCLVTSLKNNNTCPLCRTNIEEVSPQPSNPALSMEECVDIIKDELDMFPIEDHLQSIMLFGNPRSALKNMLQVYSVGLCRSILMSQDANEDNDLELSDEEEEEEEEEMRQQQQAQGRMRFAPLTPTANNVSSSSVSSIRRR